MDETERENNRIKTSTGQLLNRLRKHHDYSVPQVPQPLLVKFKQPDYLICHPVIPTMTAEQHKRFAVRTIQEAVAKSFAISPEEMISDRKPNALVRPRQIAMYLAAKRTPIGTVVIGRLFGGRDHTTVLNAISRIKELIAVDLALCAKVEAIDAELMQ